MDALLSFGVTVREMLYDVAPIAGILIVDYFLVHKTELDVDELFRREGKYTFKNGWNPVALLALCLGVAPNVPGFLKAAGFVESVPAMFEVLYTYAWFVGFGVAGLVHGLGSHKTLLRPNVPGPAAPEGRTA